MMCALLYPEGDTYVGSAVESVPEELFSRGLRRWSFHMWYRYFRNKRDQVCVRRLFACYIQHTPVVIGTRTKRFGRSVDHCRLFIVIFGSLFVVVRCEKEGKVCCLFVVV